KLIDGGAVAHVAHVSLGLAAGGSDGVDRFAQLFFVGGDTSHGGAIAGQGGGDRPADPPRGPSNQGNLVLEIDLNLSGSGGGLRHDDYLYLMANGLVETGTVGRPTLFDWTRAGRNRSRADTPRCRQRQPHRGAANLDRTSLMKRPAQG